MLRAGRAISMEEGEIYGDGVVLQTPPPVRSDALLLVWLSKV